MEQLMRLFLSTEMIMLLIDQPLSMGEPLRGHKIKAANIPFVASLANKRPEFFADRAHFCSGSLIAEDLVLTAAHCLENETYEGVDVMIGVTKFGGWQPKYDVKSWITFERWAASKSPRKLRHDFKDLAVLRLNSRVTGIIPANLTTLRAKDLYRKNATVIGWADGPNATPKFLREVKVQILTPRDCERRYQLITHIDAAIPKEALCTVATPFALTTKGDSGGPLLGENNNVLGLNLGFCPTGSYNCTEELANERRFNLHLNFIDDYRQFIDEIKSNVVKI